jgi:hypothetical protein
LPSSFPGRRFGCLALLLCLYLGCSSPTPPQPEPVNKPKAHVQAASLLARTAHGDEAAPEPAPARETKPAVSETKAATSEPPTSIDESPALSQETAAEAETPMLVEFRPPAIAAGGGKSGGMFEGSITGAIETNIETAMKKGNLTWAEIQRSAKVQRAFNEAAATFARVMNEPDAKPVPMPPIRRDEGPPAKPPFVRCVVLSMDGCGGCITVKAAIGDLVKKKGYTRGLKPTDDFQVYEWNDKGAEALRRKYKSESYPTLLLLKEDGTEVSRWVGGLRADKLEEWLEASRENVAKW